MGEITGPEFCKRRRLVRVTKRTQRLCTFGLGQPLLKVAYTSGQGLLVIRAPAKSPYS